MSLAWGDGDFFGLLADQLVRNETRFLQINVLRLHVELQLNDLLCLFWGGIVNTHSHSLILVVRISHLHVRVLGPVVKPDRLFFFR